LCPQCQLPAASQCPQCSTRNTRPGLEDRRQHPRHLLWPPHALASSHYMHKWNCIAQAGEPGRGTGDGLEVCVALDDSVVLQIGRELAAEAMASGDEAMHNRLLASRPCMPGCRGRMTGCMGRACHQRPPLSVPLPRGAGARCTSSRMRRQTAAVPPCRMPARGHPGCRPARPPCCAWACSMARRSSGPRLLHSDCITTACPRSRCGCAWCMAMLLRVDGRREGAAGACARCESESRDRHPLGVPRMRRMLG
jgi:hypothetical protein